MPILEKICKRMVLLCSNFLFMYVTAQVVKMRMYKRVKSFLPEFGQIGIMCITDKQFGNIELFNGKKAQDAGAPGQQLELF